MPEPFYPFNPSDSSCANLSRCHHNLSSMWIITAMRLIQAGRRDLAHAAIIQAQMQVAMRNFMTEIAMLNQPPEPEILIVFL